MPGSNGRQWFVKLYIQEIIRCDRYRAMVFLFPIAYFHNHIGMSQQTFPTNDVPIFKQHLRFFQRMLSDSPPVSCMPLIPGRHRWACARLKVRHTPKSRIMNSNLFIAYLIFSSLICFAATRSAFSTRMVWCLPPSFSNSSMTSSLSSGMVNCGTAYTVRTSLFPSVTSTSL